MTVERAGEPRRVELTEHGRRLLAPARRLLAAVDAAVGAVHSERHRVLRVDVVDGRLAPLRLVRRLVEEEPDAQVALSMRQRLSAALPALVRGELDAAFGRVHDVTGAWPVGLTSRLVLLEPVNVVVARDHVLAGRSTVDAGDLRKYGAWVPCYGTPSEWVCYVQRFAETFDIPLRLTGPVVDEEQFVQAVAERADQVTLTGGDVSYDHLDAVRSLRVVDPTPLYPWSLVWRRHDTHHLVDRLRALARADRGGGPAFDAAEHWLPEEDREALTGSGDRN